MTHNDEFYIGYLDKAPPGLAALMRRVVIALALGLPALVGLVAAMQRELPDGVFEFGVSREFEGVIYEKPIPTLRIQYATADGDPAVANLLLVGLGKWGLPDAARGYDGKKVRFKGSLVYKQNMTMVEMNNLESFEVLGSPTPAEARQRVETVGDVLLEGELVDTKCFLGVMRPATGKVHRACAIRCLSGGIPPGLLVRGGNKDLDPSVVLLVGPDGGPASFDVQMAGRTVSASGVLEIQDGLPVLRTENIRARVLPLP